MPEDIIIAGKKITKELVEILIKRIEVMPPDTKLAALGKVMNKEDIIRAVKERTPFGLKILALEAEYYKDLIRN